MTWLVFLITVMLAGVAQAQTDIAAEARAAQAMLQDAHSSLDQAESARDRVTALTGTIQAYEEGLAAMREGLRRVSLRQSVIQGRFDAESEELSQLLGILSSLQSSPGPLLLLHPSGPLGTARSGMMVSAVAPAIQARVDALKNDLDQVVVLRALQESALETLESGLRGAQEARTLLSKAISQRVDLPRRFTADAGEMQRLIDSSETLEAFASGLTDVELANADAPIRDFATAKGALPLPVSGTILRRAGEADAAGIRRPGLVLATRPRSIVTAPWPSTIRYRGPLLDYGNVIILEPSTDTLLVLAGLDEVYGDTGQVVPAGEPVGMMGGDAPDAETFLADPTDGGGDAKPETLYMEVRQGGMTVDPSEWFAVGKE